jgi:hypothetical protein
MSGHRRTGPVQALEAAGTIAWGFLYRYQTGDWEEVDDTERTEDEISQTEGLRMLTACRLPGMATIVGVITQADSPATALLLPSTLLRDHARPGRHAPK